MTTFNRKAAGETMRAAHINELQVAIEEATASGSVVATQLANVRVGVYNVLDFGALGDGVTDDTQAIQDACDAADSGGGYVYAPPGVYPFSDVITVPDYVPFVGAGRYYPDSGVGTKFLATTADAFLDFPNATQTKNGNFTVDGGDVATRGVRVPGCHKAAFRDIAVVNVAGDAFRMHNVQNSVLDNIETSYSTRGFWVDDGCGLVVVSALSSHDNTEFQLKIGSSGLYASGLTEPTAISFINPMLEWIGTPATSDAVAVIVIEGVTRGIFVNMQTTNATSPGNARPTIKMSVEGAAQGSSITLIDAEMIGSTTLTTGIEMTDASYVHFLGRNVITGALVGISIDGASAKVEGNAPFMNGVTTTYTYSGGAGVDNNRFHRFDFERRRYFETTAERTDLFLDVAGDGSTFAQYADGAHFWGSGVGYSYDTGMWRKGANLLGMDTGDSFEVDGLWNGGTFRLGSYRLWVDATGDLRIKNGDPSGDTDGTVVGSQS